MRSFTSALIIGLIAAALVASIPVSVIPDAPYSVSPRIMEEAISCPTGITGKPGGSTGYNASQSWSATPYFNLLPTMGPGYDICWISLPDFSTGDLQFSSQYVAWAIQFLAPQSATGTVALIGHSQGGGVNPQHALTYWPSIRPLVANYISLAGDFHGTTLYSTTEEEAAGATAANFQQTAGSNYMTQQNSPLPGSGASAIVPTTSIFTYEDDIAMPQLYDSTSRLPGAGNHAIQDQDVCGWTAVSEHFALIMSPQAFGLAFAALVYGSPVDLTKFDTSYCLYKDYQIFNPTHASNFTQGVAADLIQNTEGAKVFVEPPLQVPYVCARGFATTCGPAFVYQE
ncbi:hypothetical protein RQP46_004630 [Phenoliferia psychrophenolica]